MREALAFSVKDLRALLRSSPGTRRRLEWERADLSIIVERTEDGIVVHGPGETENVAEVATVPVFDKGEGYLLVCPSCGKNRRALYLTYLSPSLRCRVCASIRYTEARPNEVLDRLDDDLRDLSRRVAQIRLVRTFGLRPGVRPVHPDVRTIRREIARVRSEIESLAPPGMTSDSPWS